MTLFCRKFSYFIYLEMYIARIADFLAHCEMRSRDLEMARHWFGQAAVRITKSIVTRSTIPSHAQAFTPVFDYVFFGTISSPFQCFSLKGEVLGYLVNLCHQSLHAACFLSIDVVSACHAKLLISCCLEILEMNRLQTLIRWIGSTINNKHKSIFLMKYYCLSTSVYM